MIIETKSKNITLQLDFPKGKLQLMWTPCQILKKGQQGLLKLVWTPCSILGPNDVIRNIAIYNDDTTLYTKYDQASDLWQQLELASELESDLWDTVDWGRKWLVDFNAGKTQLVSSDQSNNTGATDVKMDWSVFR